MMNSFILIVDDEETLTFFLKNALEERKFYVEIVHRLKDAKKSIQSRFPDLILLDLNLPDGDGLDLFRMMKEKGWGIPTIVITAHASIKSAIEAMKLGVDDYIIKPFELEELIMNIEKQLKRNQLNNQFNYYRQRAQQSYQHDFFLSNLDPIKRIQDLALKVAQVEESVILIEGGSGTGKEMLARFMHHHSPQSDSPFVEINCASLPEQLLESELFGYEPGAFTDAKKRKIGLIELSRGGTLFLDEISEMSSSLQAKLLRFIETRIFRRLGGIHDVKVSVRIIAATNRNIREYVDSGKFREDLFFRLNMFHFKLPALAERRDEIMFIAQFFLDKIARQLQRPVRNISDEVKRIILNYDWPGNIRELRNTIERAVILCDGDTIDVRHMACEMMQSEISLKPMSRTLEDLNQTTLRAFLDQAERTYLQQALQVSNGNQLKAAELLGEPRHIIRYLIKKHGLTIE